MIREVLAELTPREIVAGVLAAPVIVVVGWAFVVVAIVAGTPA